MRKIGLIKLFKDRRSSIEIRGTEYNKVYSIHSLVEMSFGFCVHGNLCVQINKHSCGLIILAFSEYFEYFFFRSHKVIACRMCFHSQFHWFVKEETKTKMCDASTDVTCNENCNRKLFDIGRIAAASKTSRVVAVCQRKGDKMSVKNNRFIAIQTILLKIHEIAVNRRVYPSSFNKKAPNIDSGIKLLLSRVCSSCLFWHILHSNVRVRKWMKCKMDLSIFDR